MYQIAREKLRMIATHMDKEQFEILFSRVMSLVPPKELESLLGSASATKVNDCEAEGIGDLVRNGYAAWEAFDRQYRDQAEQIRALQPGEAKWVDLREFLIRTANAKPAPEVKLTAFEVEDDEVVSRDEYVPAISIGAETFVCADTAGSSAESEDGKPVDTLGMNHSLVREQLRLAAMASMVGGGYVNRPVELGPEFPARFGVLVFMRHAVRIAPGGTTERAVTFHVFLVDETGSARELPAAPRALLTREIYRASRARQPSITQLSQVLGEKERELAGQLRAVTDEERTDGVRPAVWPVAAFVVS